MYNLSVNACGVATSLYTREANQHTWLPLFFKGSWRACTTEGIKA